MTIEERFREEIANIELEIEWEGILLGRRRLGEEYAEEILSLKLDDCYVLAVVDLKALEIEVPSGKTTRTKYYTGYRYPIVALLNKEEKDG